MAEIAQKDRIRLHIGAHRTGTTSLQAALHRQRPNLSARGVGFWGPHAMRAGRYPGVFRWPGMGPISAEERENIDIIVKNNTPLLEQRLKYQLDLGHRQIILSEENILGAIKVNFKLSELYPDAPLRLAVFSRVFGPYISRISLTIRSYEAYWRSAIAFLLSEGGTLPTPRKLQALTDQPLRWLDVVKDVHTAFPNAEIFVMPFESWINNCEPHIDAIFGAALGLPPQQYAHRNASRNQQQLRLKLLEHGKVEAAESLGELEAPYLPFSPAQIAQMQAVYADDLAELQRGGLARVKLLMPEENGYFG